MYDVPMPTDQPAAIVDVLGPPHERSYEIGVWDAEEGEHMHGITLTAEQALAAYYELQAALDADGRFPSA
jgi:hypothetical protein